MNLSTYSNSITINTNSKRLLLPVKKDKEDLLKEELDLYKFIYDELPCYVSIQDTCFHILRANKKTLKDFGNVIGKHCYEVYNNSNKLCHQCTIEKASISDKPHVHEQNVTINGENTRLLFKVIPVFDKQENLIRIVEIVSDITSLKHAQKLEIVSKTISEMAHNIKNVISLMNAGSYIVEKGIEEAEQERVKNGWLIIQKNIKRLSDTVVHLINYTKGKPTNLQAVNLNKIIEDIVSTLKDKTDSEHIKVKLSLDKEIKPVTGDEDGLYHAILNLIRNAVDACIMDKNRKTHYLISVKSKDYKENGCFITVKDNGCGISEKNKNKIFKDFFTTKPGTGTGLGLLTTEKTVTAHGGVISFDSSKNGTTFSIYLPYRRN